jgi:hypothetical protein
MHPRFKGVAINGVDHIGRMMLAEVGGLPPDRLEFL